MKKLLLISAACFLMTFSGMAQQIIENFEGTGAKSVMNGISGGTPSIVANPSKTGINTSDSVGKLVVDAVHDPWVGFWVNRRTDASPGDSATAWINANDNHYVHVMVYKSFKSNLKFKLEGSYSGTVEKYATTPDSGKNTKVNEWEDIVIDFSEVKGYVPVWLLSPDWDRPDLEGEVYFDNVVINNDPKPVTTGGSSVATKNEATFSVWPNPVVDAVKIKNVVALSHVTVSNMLGEQVMKIAANSSELSISMKSLQNGIYFISARDIAGNSFTSKIVKK